jgi:small conductance mechanosensitive channel
MDTLTDTTWVTELTAIGTEYGLSMLGAILVLVAGWIGSKWARRAALRVFAKTKFDETLERFFANSVRWLVLIVAVFASLELFGVQTTSLVALLGAAGLAVGLAFQGTLSNVASGVMLLVFRPFGVGDAVSVAGVTGVVKELGLFTTDIDTFDNRRIIVPNSSVFGSTIENITYHDTRRVEVAVGTDYGANLDQVRTVLEKAAHDVAGRLEDPAPAVVLTELGASSIDWAVRVWAPTSEFWTVKQALTRDIKVALDSAGIGIPFPQMDVHLDGSLAS